MQKEELLAYFSQLVPDGNWKRLGTTFQTQNSKYFYDTGTGKVLECEENEFLVVENILRHSGLSSLEETGLSEDSLLTALENIKLLTETEKIFQAPVYNKFRSQDMEVKQNHNIHQIILELTEQCNLRCRYCVYNEDHEDFRGFSTKNMTWEIAKKALDFAITHSEEEFFVTFYGGEPLLQFPLMKQCMDYTIEKIGKKKKVHFGFTTNLTLVTREMAEYFASLESCIITGSVDGPEEIHDANRIMVSHTGSFSKAMKGLKLLIDCMGEKKAGDAIGINAVLTPPYTVEKIEGINQFFRSIPWLPENITIRTSYMQGSNKKRVKKQGQGMTEMPENMETLEKSDPLEYWRLDKICQQKDEEIKYNMNNSNLARIQHRIIAAEPIQFMEQNGCCAPGERRLYVTTAGKFHVCERIGESPVIGDVENGMNLEAIKKYYIDEYAKESLPDCSNCWAVHLCSLCYASFYDEEGINIEKKKALCRDRKIMAINDLISYHQIMEQNSAYLDRYCSEEPK